MDNILKMLLGVLSVAGLIAMAIPQRNPLPAEQPVSAPAPAPAPEQARAPDPAPSPSPSTVDISSTPGFQIGAPTIDGNPINPEFGMPFGASAQTQQSNPDAVSGNQNGYTPTAFAMPGSDSVTGADMSGEASSNE